MPASIDASAPAEVRDFDRLVYRAIAAYAPDEPVCHPSQRLIALDLGCARESVNRSVRRLREAGWLRITERRWSFRSEWCHNVYELLAPYAVSSLAMRRITRRAHNTPKKMARRVRRRRELRVPLRPDHTNPKGWCGCWACRTDRTSIGRPPPRLPGPPPLSATFEQRVEQRLREKYGEAWLRRAIERGTYVPRRSSRSLR